MTASAFGVRLLVAIVWLGTTVVPTARAGLLDGAITGTVSDTDGNPVENVCVSAEGDAGSGEAITNYDGSYSVFLPKGSYKVRFFDCHEPARYVTEWWDDRPDEDAADTVEVRRLRSTEGIDATLASVPAPGISGRVTNESGDPLADACVDLVESDSGSWVDFAYTGAEGTYSFSPVPGRYRIGFVDCAWPRTYADEWYDDKPTESEADVLVLEAGAMLTADAVLAVGGAIEGRVTDASGEGVADICPLAFRADGDPVDFTYTDADGRYRIGGLRGGDYKVAFYDCRTGNEPLLEWYDDRPDFETADVVGVEAGTTASGIDAMIGASCDADADDDRLGDCEELAYGTDPHDADTDGDSFGDGFEVKGGWCAGQHFPGGSDPKNPFSTPIGGTRSLGADPLPSATNPICR